MRLFWMIVALNAAATPTMAGPLPADPLNSPMWGDITRKLFGEAQIVLDDRVKVVVPPVVENQAQVPVSADARGLPGVTKLIVFADLNPIQHVLTLTPAKADAYISFRMKVEQGTPLRAAALTADGIWHIGGVYLDAAGGGCSAPAMARQDVAWTDTIGEAQGKVWRGLDGSARLRVRFRHPMDTGLAKDNTPAFYIETLAARSDGGMPLARIELFEPVSEDPMLTLLMRPEAEARAIILQGRDNNGTDYSATVPIDAGSAPTQ